MIQRLKVPVTVNCLFNHRTRAVAPVRVMYDGREYPIQKVGFHHTERAGRTLYHVFSVAAPSMFFKLVLNTDTLHWLLEEVHDNEVN